MAKYIAHKGYLKVLDKLVKLVYALAALIYSLAKLFEILKG